MTNKFYWGKQPNTSRSVGNVTNALYKKIEKNHKDLTAVKPSHTDEVAHQISGYHGKEKITFDSFIRGSICCALIVGLLILLKGSAVYCYLFRSMAHRLYDLPTRQILPVQITFQK